MQYLFDTSTCVFFMRGRLNLPDAFARVGRENCFLSELSVAELRYGAEKSADPLHSHNSLDAFLNELNVVAVFPSLYRYAQEKVRLQRLGLLLHDEFDLLIAATALQNDHVLVTDNTKHFSRFENIKLQNWYSR